jgi:uncharacterized membrane protein YkvA (DUF1232 family)
VDAIALIALVLLGVVASWLLLIAVLWINRPTRALVGPALRLIPDLVVCVRSLLTDPTTPRSARFALAGLLVYLGSPIDLVPDFLPVIGAIDDVVLTAIVLRWIVGRLGRDRIRAAWTGDPAGLALLERLVDRP